MTSAGCGEKLPLKRVSIILTMDAFLFQGRILHCFGSFPFIYVRHWKFLSQLYHMR